MKTTASAIILAIIMGIVITVALDALDKSIYPGCKVLDQKGDILFIELDKDLEDPTDINCQRVGELVYQIARDGYMVQIRGSHFESLGVIDIVRAIDLAEGY